MGSNDVEMDLDFDPIKEQMWHYKFDPHSVEPIPMFELRQTGLRSA